MTNGRLFTYENAAEYLGRDETGKLHISAGTLKNWACQGRVKVNRYGSKVRFTREILDEIIEHGVAAKERKADAG